MKILGIDPGSKESGICLIETGKPLEVKILQCEKLANDLLINFLYRQDCSNGAVNVAIEGMVYQGRGFGQDSIQTCYFIGQMQLLLTDKGIPWSIYSRREYGQWCVAGGQLNDTTLRAALESIYGKSAKKGDPLYALRGASDKRSAFALAKYHEHQLGIK